MKKVLSVLVVLSMLLSILPATVSATHWADEDVVYLVENGAIAEDDAMLENLDAPITRSQMVKVIVSLLEGEEPIEGKEYFTDITAEDTHIAKAAENGFVNGFGDGTFRPNNPITRQDFFTIVGRAYELTGTATQEFTDADSIADYAKPYVDALQSIGIVNGYGDGTVNPRGNITIAETLAVMHRTDEHVKANAPEEQPEEEEKKPTGGGGGGYIGGSISGGHGTGGPPPTLRVKLSVELEYDFSGEYIGYLTVDVYPHYALPGTVEKMILLKTCNYSIPSTSQDAGENKTAVEKAEQYGQYITDENGKLPIPDFGDYALYIFGFGEPEIRTFTVKPRTFSDSTPPEIDMETVDGDDSSAYPCTLKVTATDDVGIARVSYVKSTGLTTTTEPPAEMNYKIHVNGRQNVTGDTITIDEDGTYYICAMDVNGNCTYRSFTAAATIEDGIKVEMSDCEYRPSFNWDPNIEYSLGGEEGVTNGPLKISVDITRDLERVGKGYFVLQDYFTTQENTAPTDKKVFLPFERDLDLSQGIDTLINQVNDKESVCVVKEFYEAILKHYTGVARPFDEGDTINLTKNGVYYIYAQEISEDFTVVRINVTNIKTASATFEIETEEDTSSEYVAHVTATATANPNAPIKQMFVVKSDYEPEAAGAYREYTPNGKAQKIWDEVSVSGEYIPVEESKFSVSEYGTYSLYMLDEYGNWGVSEVEVTAPEADDVTPNP